MKTFEDSRLDEIESMMMNKTISDLDIKTFMQTVRYINSRNEIDSACLLLHEKDAQLYNTALGLIKKIEKQRDQVTEELKKYRGY